GQGYVQLDNHGVITCEPPELNEDAFTQQVEGIGPHGSVSLREGRSISWAALNDRTWKLIFESALRADHGAELNSPGSKGRIGGGYGGFFLRVRGSDNVE